jgi:hypothetical protein
MIIQIRSEKRHCEKRYRGVGRFALRRRSTLSIEVCFTDQIKVPLTILLKAGELVIAERGGLDLWIEALKKGLENDIQVGLLELHGLEPLPECRDSVNVPLVLLLKAGDTIVAEVPDRELWIRVLKEAINDDALVDGTVALEAYEALLQA